MNAGGATAAAMVQHAALAIDAGLATTVACVFSDAPLKPPKPAAGGKKDGGSAAAYGFARGLNAAYGQFGVNALYAHGRAPPHASLSAPPTTTSARSPSPSARGRTATRPRSSTTAALTLDDYHRSRWIVEPFHLLDCCLVSNGGAAVIVTSAERARDLRQPPVYLWGFGQGHPGGDPVDTLTSGAPLAKQTAFAMAGIDTADVDVAELYDCYTFTVLVTLEDYGFCPKGESGPLRRDGSIAPGGRSRSTPAADSFRASTCGA